MAPPPPPPQSAPNHQATVQFLSSMLSQRGPDALPYTEDTKWLIRQHALTLISTYPSLEPKTAIFTHNDGRTVNLLQADGTIPMPFQGVTYNIPVIIWLIESYPRHPPVVYVNPTRDMIIKRPHPHVNPSGLVSAPYLQNWVYPSSNLVDLVRELSSVFGRDPPLYSQRRSPNPNPNPSISNPHNPNFGGSQSSLSHFSNSSSFGSLGPSGYPPPPQPAVARPAPYSPSPYGGGRTEDAAEVFKRNAIGKLVESVNADVSQLAKARSAEMEGLISAQMVLKKRQEDLNNGIKEMLDEKEALERRMQGVVVNTDLLEEWVRKNEGKSKMKGDAVDVDIDNVFECTDVLSK